MNDTKTTDELIELMRRAKAGDKTAFESVYSRFYLPVYHYLARRLPSTKDAEDLAQQVFMRLFTSHTPFNDQQLSPLAYLFTIARNITNSFWHKEIQHPSFSLDTAEEIPEPADLQKTIELSQTLKSALATLPKEQQSILEYKFKLGLTTEEIALKLGKTTAAIRQMQCRALRQLRDYLEV